MNAGRSLLRAEILDVVRDPLALLQRALPLFVFAIGIGIAAVTAIVGDEGDELRRRIGADAAVVDDDVLVAALVDEDLVVIPVGDPETAVADGSLDAAVVLGADGYVVLDRDDEDDPPRVGVTARRARLALAAVDDRSNPVPTLFPRVVIEVEPSLTQLRMFTSVGVASAVLGLLATVLGPVTARLRDDHRSGVLPVQLSLPIGRRRLLLVKVGAEAVLTVVAMSPFLVLFALLGAVVTLVDDGALAAMVVCVACALSGIATLATFGLAGLLLTARHPDRPVPAVATLVGFLVGGALTVWALVTDGEVSSWIGALPIAGLWEVTRRSITGDLGIGLVAVAVASSAAAVAALLRWTVRAAEADDLAVRAR